MLDDETEKKKKPVHDIGEDLAKLSVEELGDRIALLKEEIVRLESALAGKQATRRAADAFFKH